MLLAEDDDDLRTGLAHLLELDGFTVRTVTNGSQLLDALGSALLAGRNIGATVDVLVSDVRMPGMNGLAIAEGLRAAGWELPIVLITAYADEAVWARVERIGGVQCLAKPCDLDTLESVLDRVISQERLTH